MTMHQPHTQTTTQTTDGNAALLDEILADVVAAGKDTRALPREQRAALLTGLSHRLGLNPLSGAVMFLNTNGRETLYVTKQGTDQIAAREKLRRETIVGPEVRKVGTRDVVFCQVRATHPDGRSEVSTATLAFSDPVNDLMKCETKAKRRATLSVCGMGLLAEDEIETIPGASPSPVDARPAQPLPPLRSLGIEPPARHAGREVTHAVAPSTGEPIAPPDDLADPERDAIRQESAPDDGPPGFAADVQAIELPGEAVGVWMKHRVAVAGMEPTEREAAWKALCARVEEVGKMKSAKVWLKKAIAEEDARRQAAASSEAAS